MPGTPLLSDRAAFDVDNYPELHSSDLALNAPVHHVPAGTTIGDSLQWDGSKWILSSSAAANPPIMTLGTHEGDVEVASSPFKIYNRYGGDRLITEVYLSVDTAPTGDDIEVDVKVDGVSIFTGGSGGSLATILAGASTGSITVFDLPTWPAGSYLTWNIAQIGSSIPGANLVVHITHEAAPSGS